jgi:ethanolamine ammonia-lyase small subunit
MKDKQGDIWATMKTLQSAKQSLTFNDSTTQTLDFGARLYHLHQYVLDASLHTFQSGELRKKLEQDHWEVITLQTQAQTRQQMLDEPSKAVLLNQQSELLLQKTESKPQTFVTIVIQDGLSSKAVETHALNLVRAFHQITSKRKASFTPLIIMHQALLPIGEKAASRWPINWALVIRGERPTLGNSKEIGAYFYDMAFGEGLKSQITLSEAKNSYITMAQAMADALWIESARLGLFPALD